MPLILNVIIINRYPEKISVILTYFNYKMIIVEIFIFAWFYRGEKQMYNICTRTVFLREQFFGRKSFDHGIYDNAAKIQSKKNRGLEPTS